MTDEDKANSWKPGQRKKKSEKVDSTWNPKSKLVVKKFSQNKSTNKLFYWQTKQKALHSLTLTLRTHVGRAQFICVTLGFGHPIVTRWSFYDVTKLSQNFCDGFLWNFSSKVVWPRWLYEFMHTNRTLLLAFQVNFFILHHESLDLCVRQPDETPLAVYWTRHSKKVRLW